MARKITMDDVLSKLPQMSNGPATLTHVMNTANDAIARQGVDGSVNWFSNLVTAPNGKRPAYYSEERRMAWLFTMHALYPKYAPPSVDAWENEQPKPFTTGDVELLLAQAMEKFRSK